MNIYSNDIKLYSMLLILLFAHRRFSLLFRFYTVVGAFLMRNAVQRYNATHPQMY